MSQVLCLKYPDTLKTLKGKQAPYVLKSFCKSILCTDRYFCQELKNLHYHNFFIPVLKMPNNKSVMSSGLSFPPTVNIMLFTVTQLAVVCQSTSIVSIMYLIHQQ